MKKQPTEETTGTADVTEIRAWGTVTVLEESKRYRINRIEIKPGAHISTQMHYHRSEHWIVVSGTARVVCGGEEKVLMQKQSTYVPMGTPHRVENPGVIPLVMIEVQNGEYLGEDDIVRFEKEKV
ncbi:MAG: cupin domain-containing protein [Leptolyngbya sp. Prado105]|nr:cupin domain-containing protein [Leptolyngbya sp. Prado105]